MSNRIVLVIVSLFALGLTAQESRPPAATAPVPSQRLDLSSAGYKELSAMARRSDKVNFTINFLDRDRVLLTYNPKKMITRRPECPPTHDDHLIHAAVLDAASGKILHSTDWYLHDGWRYLWPLSGGEFLLRRLNSLYEIDSNLNEKLLFTSPEDLLWVTVTPDGKQIVTETLDPEAKSKSKKASRVRVEFRNTQSLAVERTIKSEKEIHVEATSSGFASVISGLSGRVWLVRFGPSEQQRENIARVRTRRRAPDILYLSGNALMIGRDSASHPGYSVSAFTVTGNRLWRQHWDEHRYSLLVERSEDGSRFAISTLRPVDKKPAPAPDSAPDEDVEGLEQTIQIFNTASGDPVLSVDASPVVLSGQNFSLSPDGRRLAVLHGAAVDLYDLPEMTQDERAKYTAVKADVPGLYMPPGPVAGSPDQEAAFTAPDENGMAPDRPQAPAANSSATEAKPTDAAAANQASSSNQAGPAHQVVAANPPAPAVKPAADASAIVPTFRARRQIVALDVVVTDAKGHPIRGIAQKDFEVKEDGKAQTMSYFNEVSSAAPLPAQAPAPPPTAAAQTPPTNDNKKPANIFTNDTPPQAPSAITVILYDLLNTPAPEQQRAKLELLNFIEHKRKDEKFALCTLANGLRMIQGFTPDETVLARAIKGNKGSQRYSSMLTQDANDQMLVSWLEQGAARNLAQFGANAGVSASSLADQAGRLEQQMAERRSRDIELRMALTMDAFTQLARYLSTLPGRKSLIWLSGSFPLGIFPGMDFRNPYSENKTNTDQMKQAVNLLAESHVAVYPVDVRGLTAFSMTASTYTNGLDSTQPSQPASAFDNQASNTQRFDELSNLNSAGGMGPNLPGDSPFMEEMMDHGIMDRIAADTGGKAFYNSSGIEQAMDIALEQETNYYEVSYSPINKKYDGKFRRIKVALASGDKKIHVIHRSGYFAVDPDAPSTLSRDAATGFGLAAMQHDAPQSRQLLFEARVVPLGKPTLAMDPRAGKPVTGGKKKKSHEANTVPAEPIEMQHYQIDYAINPSQLRFDPTSDGLEHGAMNFMVASFDADGTVRTSIGSHVKGDLSAQSYLDVMTGGFRLHQEVDVPVAAASLRLGVQDAISGRVGTLELPLPVKAPPGVEQSRGPHLPEIEPD